MGDESANPSLSAPRRGRPHGTPKRRLAVIAALALVPWTVILIGGELTLVFPFGFFNTNPPELVDIYTFLFVAAGQLPRNPELLPLSVLFYLGALVSAAAGMVDREDPRLTAGLLVLAGVAHLGVAYSVSHRIYYTPIPFGALLMLGVAWWYYWPSLRATIMAPVGE
ncbi:MAG: TIGR04206 family protein [Haloglomus sp.]